MNLPAPNSPSGKARTLSELIDIPLDAQVKTYTKEFSAQLSLAFSTQDAEAATSYVIQAVTKELKLAGLDARFTVNTLRAFLTLHKGWGPIHTFLSGGERSANAGAAILSFLTPVPRKSGNGDNVSQLPPPHRQERPAASYSRTPPSDNGPPARDENPRVPNHPQTPPHNARSASPQTPDRHEHHERSSGSSAPSSSSNQRTPLFKPTTPSAPAGRYAKPAEKERNIDVRGSFDTFVKTPEGEAEHVYLTKPDYFEGKPEGFFKTELIIDPRDAVELLSTMESLRAEFEALKRADLMKKRKGDELETLALRPFYKSHYDEKGQKTGMIIIKAKSSATVTRLNGDIEQRVIPIYDQNAKLIQNPRDIYSGSRLVLSCIARPYYKPDTNQVGCRLMLDAVQVVELISGRSSVPDNHGFTPRR